MAYQGELWVWGRNTHGQLGLNSNDDKCNVPRHLPQLTRVKTVSCGREHTGIVTANGELFTFGDGAYGKLGHGDSMELFAPKKIDMLGLLVIKSVACANEHTLALTDTGDVYSWGYNTQGRLGQSKDFLSPHVSVPRMMGRLVGAEIEAIGCAGASSYALSKKVPRTLYVWGSNQFGQLGMGTNSEFEDKPLPVTFPTDKSNTKISIQQAAIGECHLVCVSTTGSLFVWGRNDDFRLGLKHSKPVNAPVLHELSNWKVTKVACGGRSTAAITAQNELFVWQYVDNDKEPSAKNPMVAGQIIIKNYDTSSESQSTSLIADVAVGGTCGGHVVCTTVGGQIWSWGKNNFGQTARPAVAHRKNTDRWTPAKVPFIAGASSLYCGGYHSVALLNSQETLFFQYVRDGNIERLKALLLKTSKFINNLSDNSTALLIACKLGLPQIVNTLISFRASALIHDENGQNPLHVCASKYSPENPAENEKFLECLGYLQNSHAIDTSLTDHNNKTPLHLAVECGNTPAASCLIKMGASLDDKDLHQMTPLQYCTNSDAFLYKSLANKNDIFVVYEPSVKQLVVDLCKGFESYYMTSVYTSTEIEVERLISGCSIVVFIVSNECVTSPFSLSQLFTAERLQKPVFSLWKDKIKLPPKVENIVFTRQLVDFSSTAKFNESLTQLCAGLRKIVYGHSTSEADLETAVVQDARDDDEEQDTIGHYAFISYDKSDKAIAETIKNHLTLLSVSCVMSRKYDNHPDAKEILSKKIVGCGVFISVLSKKSMKELAFRAELALAENHKRPILVVFPQRDITLDPSLEYTTANLPIFYVSEAWLEQLHEIICIHERIAASTEILQK